MPHQPYQKGTFQTRNVPSSLLQVLNRDLKVAGIPKRDERDRTVDVHALRTTFGTYLSKGGVPPRTAQAAMRHSDPALTANVTCVIADRCQRQICCNLYPVNGAELTITRSGCDDRELAPWSGVKSPSNSTFNSPSIEALPSTSSWSDVSPSEIVTFVSIPH